MANTTESNEQRTKLEKSTEQLNYLMVGLYGGIISFSVQGFTIGNFYQPNYVTSLVAIIILLTGMGFGLALLNEKLQVMQFDWQAILAKEHMNSEEMIANQTAKYQVTLWIGAWEKNASDSALLAHKYARIRNWYLLIGVTGLFLGKLVLPLWK